MLLAIAYLGRKYNLNILHFDVRKENYKTLTAEEQQQEKAALEASFDQIFTQNTSFETLNQVLGRLNRRKSELLKVLDKPELPLHNNASEQDIREFVTKRAYQWQYSQ